MLEKLVQMHHTASGALIKALFIANNVLHFYRFIKTSW